MIVQATKHFTMDDAKQIGDQLDINWEEFSVAEFIRDLEYELEHAHPAMTDVTFEEAMLTGKMVLSHLNESPDYYSHLIEDELHRKEEPEDDFQAPQDPPEWWL